MFKVSTDATISTEKGCVKSPIKVTLHYIAWQEKGKEELLKFEDMEGVAFCKIKRFGPLFLKISVVLSFCFGVGLFLLPIYYLIQRNALKVDSINGTIMISLPMKELRELHNFIIMQCRDHISSIKDEEIYTKVSTELQKTPLPKKAIKFCPKCGSSNIDWTLPQTWSKWRCKDCGYIGTFIIEDSIIAKKIRQEHSKSKENNIHQSEKQF